MVDRGGGSELRVEEVGRGRARQVLPSLVEAFWDYEETLHLLPRERNRRRVLPRYLLADLADATIAGRVHAAAIDGAIVGGGAWIDPAGYPVGPRRQLIQALHLAAAAPWGVTALREALRGQSANGAQHRRFPPHYWLRVLGVAPSAQGRGVGRALMDAGLRIADQASAGCFLFTASRANVGWYRQFGFEPAAEFRPTTRWPTNWAMWRPPRGAARADEDIAPAANPAIWGGSARLAGCGSTLQEGEPSTGER